ncbi:MAG: hypothetical protein AAF560_28665 [Acidobacteriota bacterium]
MSEVKGTKIKSKFTFLRERFSDAMVERVLDAMAPRERSQLQTVLDLGWYDSGLFENLLGAIVRVAGGGDEAILNQVGRYGAEDLSQNAYRAYFRSGDPETVLAKMVPIHAKLNRPGEMEILRHADQELSIVVLKPRSGPHSRLVARGFYQRSVELCGVSNVGVEQVARSAHGDEVCEFRVTWGD